LTDIKVSFHGFAWHNIGRPQS